MSGDLQVFRKNKGYESIPRDMLQRKDMSPQAKGLLAELLSFDEKWVLYKNELLRRNQVVKKGAMEKIWMELVEKKYILQYRKRVARKYEFKYIFSGEEFEREDVLKITQKMSEQGYAFYLKTSTINSLKKERNIPEEYELSNHELSLLLWEPRNWVPKENLENKGFVENPEVGSPKLGTKRTINKQENDDEINKFNAREIDFVSALVELGTKTNDPQKLVQTSKLLKNSGFVEHDVIAILNGLIQEPKLHNPDVIIEQINWVSMKSKTEGIINVPTYFLNGLRRKVQTKKIQSNHLENEAYKAKVNPDNSPDVPLYNWIRREDNRD